MPYSRSIPMTRVGYGDAITWPAFKGDPNDPRHPGCPCEYGYACICAEEEARVLNAQREAEDVAS